MANIRCALLRCSVLVRTKAEQMVSEEVNEKQYVSNKIREVFKDVGKEMYRLVSNRHLVRLKVEATDRKTDKVSDDVFVWLKETDIVIQEVENVTLQARRTQQWNPLIKLLKKITTLNMKSEFDPFSFPIPSLEHFSSGNIVCFESREKASDQLLAALQDDNCSMIGLYGRQGSGKTTLVKAMGEKGKFLKIFDEVLFATVSQNANIRTMQEEIADSLDISFDKNSEAGRARRIFSTIESMNRPILVIFDDVQVKFDPEDVGIPCNSNRCKILLTTRGREYCDMMYSQRNIQLDSLSKEEAWTLFEKHSGIHDEECSSSFDLLNVAHEVAFECEGMPKLIKDVASSLRSKPIDEWKASLDSLKHSMAKWQIFLSFRGEDTRYAFTGSLYQALRQGGFKTFMDDGGLQTGDQISPSLLNAIEASRLSIIVLSENYANSTWCLDELVKILECKKLKNQLVWPIFYKVDPSDIRHIRKCFGKDMARHENIFGIDSEKVQKWKSALFEVSNLSGIAYTTSLCRRTNLDHGAEILANIKDYASWYYCRTKRRHDSVLYLQTSNWWQSYTC
ncbi:probable disease resistance protein At1g52660 isoform X2 [Vicia villosa]|uniref:probable disease resistance protein At1g52660 isoform X2 n=1 Tax=Vicia villosa TaxID=3911 RepID=UPI00273A8FDD|nr:probable disease resistance protein At1g52660 isoform X2 [Vicia villosa]